MGRYQAPANAYDEYLDAAGKPRPHWEKVSQSFGQITPEDWDRRQNRLDSLVQENGITYNVYQEDKSNQRPWSMDMLPLVLEAHELKSLEASLSQRAHLLNVILGDVYGRQTLLRSGGMHPYLLYANPSFHHPCHGLLPNRHRHIQIYSADITRSPSGKWWVLGDRVENPSGLGYALANRMLSSRLFPQIMQSVEVSSLQPFINAFTGLVESLTPYRADQPNVALLTPGPNNQTYFEQSFLARNLGYTLAEGADLAVRNNQLFMKTIGGVQRVDVLLRRSDTSWTDPLELRSDSTIGIPGLLNAVRQGNLSIANSLGSGVVENTATLAFLPWHCRNFLGESLEIPSVATWWCGQPSERKYVIENIDKLAIKPTFWQKPHRSYFGPSLAAEEKEELIARINHRPEQYCGQEIVSNATLPAARNGQNLEPRNFQLRVFLVAFENGWRMMPGGFARYSYATNDPSVAQQKGGESKDTWVLQSKTAKTQKRQSINVSTSKIRRHSNDLPSRSADNLFWLGRYIERAESLARFCQTLWTILIEESSHEHQHVALPFLEQIIPYEDDSKNYLLPDSQQLDIQKTEDAIINALFDERSSTSLISNFNAIERTAAKVKERLSSDTWKRLAAMRDIARKSSSKNHSVYDDNTAQLLDRSLEALSSFIGNLMENTTRTQGWRFLQLGRRIERGIATANILRSSFVNHTQGDEDLILKLLAWGDSAMTYRRRYLNTFTEINALDVLCLDSDNPRSLAFQAQELQQILTQLPHASENERDPINQIALRIYSSIALVDLADLTNNSREPDGQLDKFFSEIVTGLQQLAMSIERSYFAHTQPQAEQTAKINLG